jgi:hypothetical protein
MTRKQSYSAFAACLPRRSGTEAGVLDCVRQAKRDATFPAQRLPARIARGRWNLDVPCTLRSFFRHSRYTLCIPKLYPVTAYYRLFQPITAKLHLYEKYCATTNINCFSESYKSLTISCLKQSKIQNSPFKIRAKTWKKYAKSARFCVRKNDNYTPTTALALFHRVICWNVLNT